MNKIVFVIPYFGRLPQYYLAWRKSALANKNIDFLFVTDISEIYEEGNIHVIKMTFSELVDLVQSKFEFQIILDEPYKLCDFKPAYGYIFSDYIQGYKFWGHCDIDIILGQINHFITKEVLENYDKIYEHGHMTLYRNTLSNNTLFKNLGEYPEYNYGEVYSSSESFYFDEFYGMMLKSRRLKTITYLSNKDFFDVSTQRQDFFDVHGSSEDSYYFEWNNGRLYAVNKSTKKQKEIIYVHFQKRSIDYKILKNNIGLVKQFFIIPDMAVNVMPKELITIEDSFNFKLHKNISHIKDFAKRYKKVKSEYKSIFDYYMSRKQMKERRKQANLILDGEKCQ